MKTYHVFLEFIDKKYSSPNDEKPVTFEKKFEIKADSEEEAIEKAKEKNENKESIWDSCAICVAI